jgi:hypothetical protein
MMMYMYLRYGDQCLPKNVGVGNTLATDSNMIDLFLQWNADDPVSAVEDQRNTYLGSTTNTYRQGNRNPFIDNPYLATLIWGGPAAQNRWPGLANVQFDALEAVGVYPNPSSGTATIESGISIDDIQLLSISGQLVREVSHPVLDARRYQLDNLPKGFYLLRLTSGEKTSVRKLVVK